MSEKTVRLKLATKDVETLLGRTASIERAIQQDDALEVAVAAPTLPRTKDRVFVSSTELKQLVQNAVAVEFERLVGYESDPDDICGSHPHKWPRPRRRPWPQPQPPLDGPHGPCPPPPGALHDDLEHSVFDTMQKLHSLSSQQDPAAIERVLNEALTQVRDIDRRTATIK